MHAIHGTTVRNTGALKVVPRSAAPSWIKMGSWMYPNIERRGHRFKPRRWLAIFDAVVDWPKKTHTLLLTPSKATATRCTTKGGMSLNERRLKFCLLQNGWGLPATPSVSSREALCIKASIKKTKGLLAQQAESVKKNLKKSKAILRCFLIFNQLATTIAYRIQLIVQRLLFSLFLFYVMEDIRK